MAVSTTKMSSKGQVVIPESRWANDWPNALRM